MTRRLRVGTAAIPLVLLSIACSDEAPTAPDAARAPTAAAAPADRAPGRILVRFRPGASPAAIAAAHGATRGRGLGFGIETMGVPVGREVAVARAIAKNPNVEFAEPDWIRTTGDPTCPSCVLPSDALFGYKWDLHNDGSIVSSTGQVVASTGTVDADVDWLEAFDRLGSVPGSARVAILDTGVRSTHEDLAGKVVDQWDFANGDADATDHQGHGTHVAGIAAANGDDGVGVTGVGWPPGVGILAGKVCTPTFFGLNAECPSSAIVEAIGWAVERGANAINLSLGGTEGSESERVALGAARSAGVLAFCAAGNNGRAGVLYPAAFDECVAVGATDWSDEQASYSNWGPEVLLSAPGGDSENASGYSQIASTCFDSDAAWCLKAGTSMATPQAAGLAALLFALGAGTADEVLARMIDTAVDLGPAGRDERFGHGRIDVFAATAGLEGGGAGNSSPTADFSWTCDGLACDFIDASSDPDGTIVSRSWSFGDGATSTATNPSHAWACAGDHTVTLTVTDDGGRAASASRTVSVSGAGGAPGDPTAIPGLLVWLDAGALSLADGDPVADWPDGSGACHGAAQPVASKRPVFRTGQAAGRAAVVFDATDDGMSTPVDPGSEVTIVAVYASRAAASGHLLNGGFAFFMGPYVGRYRNYTGAYATGDPVEAGRWVVHTLRQGAALHELFVDGALAASTDRRADPGPLGLAKQGPYGLVLDGAVAELLVWDRALTDGELATVHDRLVERYLPEPDENAPPVAGFTAACENLECAFVDQSADADGTIVARSWDFGDGSTSSATSPTHPYAAGGTYTVTLAVTDDAGATDATTRSITVTEPSGGPFVDPSSLAGLALWLKADAVTGLADGDPVSTWPDASPAGADALQAVAARRPVYRTNRIGGLPALAFDAADDGMSTPVDPPTETTVFVVYRSRAGESGHVLNGGFAFFLGPYVGRYRNYTGGYATGPKVEPGRWVIQILRQGPGLDELWIDGALEGTTKKTADPGPIRLAAEGTYGRALDGELAEVIVYDRALDDAERAEVAAWISAKYGTP